MALVASVDATMQLLKLKMWVFLPNGVMTQPVSKERGTQNVHHGSRAITNNPTPDVGQHPQVASLREANPPMGVTKG